MAVFIYLFVIFLILNRALLQGCVKLHSLKKSFLVSFSRWLVFILELTWAWVLLERGRGGGLMPLLLDTWCSFGGFIKSICCSYFLISHSLPLMFLLLWTYLH